MQKKEELYNKGARKILKNSKEKVDRIRENKDTTMQYNCDIWRNSRCIEETRRRIIYTEDIIARSLEMERGRYTGR